MRLVTYRLMALIPRSAGDEEREKIESAIINFRQKYSYRRLLALNEDGEQYVDSFR